MEGFGVYSNLTLTDSESTTDTRVGEELPFLKQSDTIANLAFTYENETFLVESVTGVETLKSMALEPQMMPS